MDPKNKTKWPEPRLGKACPEAAASSDTPGLFNTFINSLTKGQGRWWWGFFYPLFPYAHRAARWEMLAAELGLLGSPLQPSQPQFQDLIPLFLTSICHQSLSNSCVPHYSNQPLHGE